MKILAKQRLKAWFYEEEDDYDDDKKIIDRCIERYVDYGEVGISEWTVQEAMYYYANKTPMTLYRGLNFTTQQDYKNFMSQIKGNYLTTGRPTSWSKSKKIAEDFATSKQFNLGVGNSFLLDDYKKAQSVNGGGISGYRGVLLITNIKYGEGLDLSANGFNGAEAEVVLPAGKYKVKVIEYLTYRDQYEGKTPSEVLRMLTDRSKFLRVLGWFKEQGLDADDLDQELKRKIALKHKAKDEAKYIRLNLSDSYEELDDVILHSVSVSLYHMPNFEEMRWYDDDTQAYILNKVKKAIKVGIKDIMNKVINTSWPKTTNFDKVKWLFDIDYFVKKFNLQSDLRALEKRIEKAHNDAIVKSDKKYSSAKEAFDDYNKLNSLDNIRRIESIKDPIERYKAFEQYKADILNAIQQIGRR